MPVVRNNMVTRGSWLKNSSQKLKKISLSPYLDAELILLTVFKISREKLISTDHLPLTTAQLIKANKLLKRRLTAEPMAYILGNKSFYGLDFFVNKHVLIPHPDSESLVTLSLDIINPLKKPTILELGVGSGAIITSVIKNYPSPLEAFGIDISSQALKVANKNIKRHSNTPVKLINSDLLKKWPVKKPIDLIIANLPYLPAGYLKTHKTLAEKGLKFEPKISLFSGHDGLDLYRQLNQQLPKYHVNNLLIEVMPQQIKRAVKIFTNPAYVCEVKNDLGGQPRFVLITKTS